MVNSAVATGVLIGQGVFNVDIENIFNATMKLYVPTLK